MFRTLPSITYVLLVTTVCLATILIALVIRVSRNAKLYKKKAREELPTFDIESGIVLAHKAHKEHAESHPVPYHKDQKVVAIAQRVEREASRAGFVVEHEEILHAVRKHINKLESATALGDLEKS